MIIYLVVDRLEYTDKQKKEKTRYNSIIWIVNTDF